MNGFQKPDTRLFEFKRLKTKKKKDTRIDRNGFANEKKK